MHSEASRRPPEVLSQTKPHPARLGQLPSHICAKKCFARVTIREASLMRWQTKTLQQTHADQTQILSAAGTVEDFSRQKRADRSLRCDACIESPARKNRTAYQSRAEANPYRCCLSEYFEEAQGVCLACVLARKKRASGVCGV